MSHQSPKWKLAVQLPLLQLRGEKKNLCLYGWVWVITCSRCADAKWFASWRQASTVVPGDGEQMSPELRNKHVAPTKEHDFPFLPQSWTRTTALNERKLIFSNIGGIHFPLPIIRGRVCISTYVYIYVYIIHIQICILHTHNQVAIQIFLLLPLPKASKSRLVGNMEREWRWFVKRTRMVQHCRTNAVFTPQITKQFCWWHVAVPTWGWYPCT